MERNKQVKREKREQEEAKKLDLEKQRLHIQKNINKANPKKLGDSVHAKKKIEDKVIADSLENDLNIPVELKDIIEEADEELILRFEDPQELMEIFSTLEEKNLFLIKRC